MAETTVRKSPLHSEHERLGARFIEFGGWNLPVQFSSIVDEHTAVRSAVGVFDISHMGELRVSGAGAEAWLNRMLSNNVTRIEPGEGQYTFLLNETGGVIDDLILYRLEPSEFLLIVNAARITMDVEWLTSHLPAEGVDFQNQSDAYAGIAVQGPLCAPLFDSIFGANSPRPARNEITRILCDSMDLHLARTGYTGEDGFEAFFPIQHAEQIWRRVLEHGAILGLKPCGLGARDTLRLEMCYPLNGSDLSPNHTPLEAGLSIFVDLAKEEFMGKAALLRQKQEGVPNRLVPFRMTDKSPPPRPHYPVYHNGQQVSEISSGTLSPSLNMGIGMTYLPTPLARINEQIEIEIRGKRFPAVVEKKPLYRK